MNFEPYPIMVNKFTTNEEREKFKNMSDEEKSTEISKYLIGLALLDYLKEKGGGLYL